jgi:glycosyltransferase involved in cell wall biosynthesis
MAHALPVVVGEGDGTQTDLVRQNVNGWLIESPDPKVLAETLATALSDPDRLRQMGQESLRIVMSEFNVEQMVDRFVEAVEASCRNYARDKNDK